MTTKAGIRFISLWITGNS